jgi:hypothetical protein
MVEYRRVICCNYLHRINFINKRSIQRRQSNLIAQAEISQLSEKRVAVSRNGDVSRLTRQGGSCDMADRPLQRPSIGAFHDYDGYANSADLNPSEHGAISDRRTADFLGRRINCQWDTWLLFNGCPTRRIHRPVKPPIFVQLEQRAIQQRISDISKQGDTQREEC